MSKRYGEGARELRVLDDVNFYVNSGEWVAIVGRSGSGKSTLMHILAGLDSPDRGEVYVAGECMSVADQNRRAALRGEHLGFVYQNHHLLPEFSALENVAMPLRISGREVATAEDQASQLLSQVGLGERLQHLPAQLSGGERQRVAVARALAGRPAVVLADEPTGNLDAESAATVNELLLNLAREHDAAIVVVTHDETSLHLFDRVYQIRSGVLNERGV
ncbi:MAG: ABC transporter ATP-binding protein [Pseudomonadota bacterium]